MSYHAIPSPEFFKNMPPTYAWLREHEPVHFIEPIKTWFVSRYADVRTILDDNENFSVENMPITDDWHPAVKEITSTLWVDDPDHARLRGVVNRFFSLPVVMKREEMVSQIVDAAIEKVKSSGKTVVDVEKDIAYTVPIDVLSMIMGLPREDYKLFHHWAPLLNEALMPGQSEEQKEIGGRTANEVRAYLIEHFRKGDLKPYGQDTVLSLLKDAVEKGVMTEEEMVLQAVQLYIGGHETTLQFIGLCLHALLTHPAELAKVKADPKLALAAADETARWDGVSQVIVRRVAKDYTMHGVTMKADEMLYASNGAANRDPEAFDRPDEFIVDRPKSANPSVGFGRGIRYCLGVHLAKLETRLAVNAFFEAFPEAHLPQGHEPLYNHNLMMHGLKSLPVELY